MAVEGPEKVSIRRLNAYISHYQRFFGWAVGQGYCDTNLFEGFRFAIPKKHKEDLKDVFSPMELATIYQHLAAGSAVWSRVEVRA